MLYGYKALLQVAALVFSFSIRKVKVKGVNDAKYVAAAVYVTSIVTAVIFVSLYSLKTFVNLYAALFSLGFFIGTSVILVLVFIPKVMEMLVMISLRELSLKQTFQAVYIGVYSGQLMTKLMVLKVTVVIAVA